MSVEAFKFDSPLEGEMPLLIGVSGPPGGGKSESAMILATGIQAVRGGEIGAIDTEGGRLRALRGKYKFRLQMMEPPYESLRFLAALQAAEQMKLACLIIDSLSDEHEGPGGVLAQHAKFLDEKAGNDWAMGERMSQSGWIEPKRKRLQLITALLRAKVPVIITFRAREKTKPMKNERGKMEPTNVGFVPIAPPEIVHAMSVNILLPPFAQGVPTWQSEKVGESFILKLPDHFKPVFARRGPVTADQGEALARWARGDKVATTKQGEAAKTLDTRTQAAVAALHAAPTLDDLEKVNTRTQPIRDEAFAANRDDLCVAIRNAYGERRRALSPDDGVDS